MAIQQFLKKKKIKIVSLIRYKWKCVCSNSRNDVLRVAQQYGTIAAHTRRRASVR